MSDEPSLVPKAVAPQPTGPTFAEFLTGTPLLMPVEVQAELSRESPNHARVTLQLPGITLHCPQETCSGMRFFDPTSEALTCHLSNITSGHFGNHFATYRCRNCHKAHKTYALRVRFGPIGTNGKSAEIMKIGETPAFGEPRPNAVKDVLDDEIKFFERGYRAETAGLGIGAFAYYRRFVESHKDKIIAEIRKVAVAQGAKQDVLDTLDKAAKMNSFENAVRTVKDAILSAPTNASITRTEFSSETYSSIVSGSKAPCSRLASSVNLLTNGPRQCDAPREMLSGRNALAKTN